MKLIINFIVSAILIYGQVFFINDTEKITDILERMNLKAKVCSSLAIFLVAVTVTFTNVYMIFWIIVEYIVIIWWYGRQKRDHLDNVRRGITGIAAMVVVELSIIYLYYYKGIENLQNTGHVNYEIQIACYLGMAFVQYIFIIIREISKANVGYKRELMIILASKSGMDMVWLYMCILTYAFKENYILSSLFFLIEIIIDYFSFGILVLKMQERTEQDKRADMHMNAYEYYLNMEEEHLKIRKMYHEMKNQLMIMEEGRDHSERESDYARMMHEKLDEVNQFYHTGYKALDMLLFDGSLKAKARNIEFDAVISEGCLDFMDEEDVNIIFSNAIINAIEACEKITDGPRQIKIKAGKNLDDILIYFKNTVSKDHNKGSLSSKKKNKIMHGIGMTSIQECVEKYGGYVSVIEEDNMFQLAILFGKE